MVNVTAMIEGIAGATKEQAHSSATLQSVIEVFRETVAESITRSDEMAKMVATLSQRSQKLEREIGRFKFD